MHISCLHTAPMSISTFEAACPQGITLAHHVRSDLRYRARHGITEGVMSETTAHLKKLSAGSDGVLVTCDILSAATEPPALTADALMAQEVNARAKARSVEVFYSWPGSQTHLEALFLELDRPSSVAVTCIAGLWECLNTQDTAAHDALVAQAVKRSEAHHIVLANPAMLGPVSDDPRVLGINEAVVGRLRSLSPSGR